MDGAYRVPPDRVRVDILVPGDGRWMWVGVWVALGGGRVDAGGGLGGVGLRWGRCWWGFGWR